LTSGLQKRRISHWVGEGHDLRRQSSWRASRYTLLRRLSFSIALFAAAAACLASASRVLAEDTRPGLEKLQIVTSSGVHEFSVEVMRTQAQRERGLMFRRRLPPNEGMLFDFQVERPISMWMKNTFLPLDMIFVAKIGKVVALAQNTEPLSKTIIPSGVPVYSVLEVNAGVAANIGLKIGDTVRHPLFGK
jgi:uncharacterized membrane protein (UPF0127 family)